MQTVTTMAHKLYPIGIQTFERIRKENKLYIDKTEYVYRMSHTNGKFFFLNRPRRFGKSLLVSTFQSYFEGKKEMFDGLAISQLEKDWTAYPVLHFSMAAGVVHHLHVTNTFSRRRGSTYAQRPCRHRDAHPYPAVHP